MRALPTGLVTFLFTDIEGSTELLRTLGDDYVGLLEEHHSVMRRAIAANDGHEFGTEGDAFFVSFERPADALAAALAAQVEVHGRTWPGRGLRIRMGIHTGDALVSATTGYVGLAVHQAARIAAAGHGGQVVVSAVTAALAADDLPAGTAVRPLGEYRLKDFTEPQRLLQLTHPELPDTFPDLRSLGPAGNVPPATGSFVGRGDDMAVITAALDGEATRLLTLVGPAGVGKTTLALEAARSLQVRYGDGVFVVPLAAVSDAALVANAIGAALGAQDRDGRPLDLGAHIGERRLLLVLDNVEHLLAATGELAALLARCPRLCLLATSRSPLHVAGEHVVVLDPLPMPDAVALFVDAAARAGVALTTEETDGVGSKVVAEICRRLDHLPLAIELAAPRLRLFSADALLARLTDRFPLLTGGGRDRPERQQTLESAIDWSYRLLSPEEQSVLRQLSIFGGGATVEAAEAVCTADGVGLVDAISSLLDHSLLRSSHAEHAPRLEMLESIRDYARRALSDAGEEDAVAQRHLAHFSALAEIAEPNLASERRDEWLARLAVEEGNLRSALEWAIDHEPTGAAVLAGNLGWYWYHRGQFAEGRSWLERAITADAGGLSDLHRARALTSLARVCRYAGDFAAAQAAADRAIAAARASGEARELAYANCIMAVADMTPIGLDFAREAVNQFRKTSDGWGLALGLFYVGVVAVFSGDRELALSSLEESEALFAERGDSWGVAGNQFYRGAVLRDTGDLLGGRALIERSIEAFRESGDRWRLATALRTLGDLLARLGEDPAAVIAETAMLEEELALAG